MIFPYLLNKQSTKTTTNHSILLLQPFLLNPPFTRFIVIYVAHLSHFNMTLCTSKFILKYRENINVSFRNNPRFIIR